MADTFWFLLSFQHQFSDLASCVKIVLVCPYDLKVLMVLNKMARYKRWESPRTSALII